MATKAFWEPQVALFQPVPIVQINSSSYRLASSIDEATHPTTRFQCRFQSADGILDSQTTLSEYPFNYEYVAWRKDDFPMIDTEGDDDRSVIMLSTLLFSCPIPAQFQPLLDNEMSTPVPMLYLDIIPIRVPVRTKEVILTVNHTGPKAYKKLDQMDLGTTFGDDNILPDWKDAGRWSNLPICPRNLHPPESIQPPKAPPKKYKLSACTWTAASYSRRGDATTLSDSVDRLREWITFHAMVGVEHFFIYDNTDPSSNNTDVRDVCNEFPSSMVTYHSWPCKVCNNNRPAHASPGERSSQYAAEASCRERYGPVSEWLSFLDVDEYLVPMRPDKSGSYSWQGILDSEDMRNVSVLQFLSSRSRPRVDLMDELEDQSSCRDPNEKKNKKYPNTDKCIARKPGETFLKTYNCEYIRPPKPFRFERARKQIYRPSFVKSHYVHYSLVTSRHAETYSEFQQREPNGRYMSQATGRTWQNSLPEVFANELSTGNLVHARSVLPVETRRRSHECKLYSPFSCLMGYICEDTVKFDDEKHKENVFQNPDGTYCNCWKNNVVEDFLVPQLEKRLQELRDKRRVP
eukprot:Nitzschia sp. Nitz4//scaffold297_size22919//13964//15775//NITZ4_008523-RA/size22919-snap-gene-0.2-mRNA-1//1//CDS//3329546304//9435//frame0